jgi:Kef-type K+ transport system membrane component KefB
MPPLTHPELLLIALLVIFTLPYLLWRFARTDHYAPLVVVQISLGVLLGPGALGAQFPEFYQWLFNPRVIDSLSAIAMWAVTLFVFLAGIELDLLAALEKRRDTLVTAGFALVVPLFAGSLAAYLLISLSSAWQGPGANDIQFMLAVGMACAVTALPILVLFLERLGVLRIEFGQRVLRYASLDDLAVWAVLALLLLDFSRLWRQLLFLVAFLICAWLIRNLFTRLNVRDLMPCSLIWLVAAALGADWCGLHFMVGAFLAGTVLDARWFGHERLDNLRFNVLTLLMPVFFLSTGLRTSFAQGGLSVWLTALLLLCAAVGGKLLGTVIAGRVLRWQRSDALLIGWLLQTKALIMIIFANILLDKQVISASMFTALLLMAVMSTMLTIPMVSRHLARASAISEAR